VHYHLKLVCAHAQEAHVRALLVQLLSTAPVAMSSLESADDPADANKVLVEAQLVGAERHDETMEQIVSRLTLEKDIFGISWRVAES